MLDDPEMETWQQYGVRAWPTLVVIDPDGYVVAMASGEGNGAALGGVIEQLLEGRADLAAGPAFTPVRITAKAALAFPGKVASDGDARIVIADTGNDRILVSDLEGHIQQVFSGFNQPQGVRFDGERLIVCDTVAGEVVAIALPGGERETLASGLRSPWDCGKLEDGRIVVAEAGTASNPGRGRHGRSGRADRRQRRRGSARRSGADGAPRPAERTDTASGRRSRVRRLRGLGPPRPSQRDRGDARRPGALRMGNRRR